MASFIIYKKPNSYYQFILKADNGESILKSEDYINRSLCRSAIDTVKNIAPYDRYYDRRTNVHGKYYFVLKAANGATIGASEFYESQAGREYGIVVTKRTAPLAAIET